jgi:transcription elongation factor Elf1
MCATDITAPLHARAALPADHHWACVRWTVTCVACNEPSPVNAFDDRDTITCLRCGQAQGLDTDQLADALGVAHMLVDPAAAGRAVHDRRGADTAIDAVGTSKTFFTYELDRIQARISPGAPLCPLCRAPLAAHLDDGALITICASCDLRLAHRTPGALAARCAELAAAIDDDNRVGVADARLELGAATGAAAEADRVTCATCGAPLAIDPRGPSIVDCPSCRTRAHLPRALLARVGAAPRAEPIWLLFRGGSPRVVEQAPGAAPPQRWRGLVDRLAALSMTTKLTLMSLGVWAIGIPFVFFDPCGPTLATKPADRLITVCGPSVAGATHALVIDEIQETYKVKGVQWSKLRHRLRVLDARAGTVGPVTLLRELGHGEPTEGNMPDCLGPAGARIWLQTRKGDAELREPTTGAVELDAAALRARAPAADWSQPRVHVPTSALVLGTGATAQVLAPDTLTLAPATPAIDRDAGSRDNWTVPRAPNLPWLDDDHRCHAVDSDRLCEVFGAKIVLERRDPHGALRWTIDLGVAHFERVGDTLVTWRDNRTDLTGYDLASGRVRWTLELGAPPE